MLSRLSLLRQTRQLAETFVRQECSFSSFRAYQRQEERRWKKDEERGSGNNWSKYKNARPLFAASLFVAVKDWLGFSSIKLDDDPLKDKIKQSWLNRKYKKFDEAIKILHDAIPEAQERKDPLVLTRIFDEMANTFYEMGDLDNAERCFRDVIQR